MIVSRSSVDHVVALLKPHARLSLDTETTGLRPYHGDRIFSVIIAMKATDGNIVPFYFNFWPSYAGFPPENVLSPQDFEKLRPLFDDPGKLWFIHKFNFDMHMLGVQNFEIAGEVFCTLTQGRVEYNEHMGYDLGESLQRIGLAKDEAVDKYIDEHKLFETVLLPGKSKKEKNKFFYKVPPDVIIPYGCSDATGGFALGVHLEASISAQAKLFPPGVPNLLDASRVEVRLAKTVYRMERVGVKIDRPYVHRALAYETDRFQKSAQAFKQETGVPYSASAKLFEELFKGEKDKWVYTDKGNPSFTGDVLATFTSPAAKIIVQMRDQKSRADFYQGFLWHADADDVIHPQFKPGGTRTFRLSSSEPNLQNLTSENATICRACKDEEESFIDACLSCGSTDVEHPEFMVRRAFIPRPGFVFFLPDYDQMEYKMMLDYAKHMMVQEFRARNQTWDEGYFEVANKVLQGFDVHRATAELMKVPRKYAKTLNFLLLYGGGPGKLAAALGISLEEATKLRNAYFRALPYVEFMIGSIISAVRKRGWIRNWAGYKYNFPNRSFAYTGPNTIIQGGCAAVTKIAMNDIDELLLPYKSRMVLTIHDELPTEIHESEIATVPRLMIEKMQNVYKHKYIPLTAGAEWSDKSLADKKKGYPV